MFNRNRVRRSWKGAALTVALPLALASPAAASAGQNVVHGIAPSSQAVINSAPYEASCGLLPPNCTVRLNRATTRNARDTAQLAGPIATAACALVPGPGAICAAVIGGGAAGLAVIATRYYEDGDCLALKIMPAPTPLVSPERVKRGEHNCS